MKNIINGYKIAKFINCESDAVSCKLINHVAISHPSAWQFRALTSWGPDRFEYPTGDS